MQPRIRLLGVLVALPMMGAACGGGGETGPTFAAEDLEGIVLQPSEAPEGAELQTTETGQRAFSGECCWAGGDVDQELLRGLVDAHYVWYTRGILYSPEWRSAEALAAVFEDRDSAAEGYEAILEGARCYMSTEACPPPFTGAVSTERSSGGLGEEGAVLDGEFHSVPGVMIVWRTGNLVLGVSAPYISAEEGRALAEEMDGRASEG